MVNPSATLTISAKAQQMKESGMDVKLFGAGEPDFDTPEHIKEAAYKAMKDGHTKYTPVEGIPELRQAVAAKFRKENKIGYAPEEILISNGGKQDLAICLQTILGKGEEVIIPAPFWVSYPAQVTLAHGTPVFAETMQFRTRADLIEEKITDKTKAIIINSPSNPTGAIIPQQEMKKINDLALEKNIFIISDEMYEHFRYDGEHVSIASLSEEAKENTLTVNGVSKTYAMTGWRLGYCGGPVEVIQKMAAIQSHTTSNASSISQYAALAALEGNQGSVEKMRMAFARRREVIVKGLQAMPGISCIPPDGAFYVFPDVSKRFNENITNSVEFCKALLEKALVAVVPGAPFGSDNHIRMSFAASLEDIKEGLERMRKLLG